MMMADKEDDRQIEIEEHGDDGDGDAVELEPALPLPLEPNAGIWKLDEFILLSIFTKPTLEVMLKLRDTCGRWKWLVGDWCARRSSMDQIEEDTDFVIAKPHYLELFQGLKCLELDLAIARSLSQFPTGWARSMTTLVLRCGFRPVRPAVWQSLSGLQQLTSLSLRSVTSRPIPNNLDVLRRLEYFELDEYRGNLVEVLRQLGPPFRRLKLNNVVFEAEDRRQFLRELPHLGAQVTSLDIGDSYIAPFDRQLTQPDHQWVAFFTTHFVNLTSLRLEFIYDFSFESLAQINTLQQLNKLKLTFPFGLFRMDRLPVDAFNRLRPMESVRVVRLLNYLQPSTGFMFEDFELLFGHLFPELEKLTVRMNTRSTELFRFEVALISNPHLMFPRIESIRINPLSVDSVNDRGNRGYRTHYIQYDEVE